MILRYCYVKKCSLVVDGIRLEGDYGGDYWFDLERASSIALAHGSYVFCDLAGYIVSLPIYDGGV